MFCVNADCRRKTFSERFEFLPYKGKRSNRLTNEIIKVSIEVSSIRASKILKILESRDSHVVTEWLKTYPNIEVVSRDGSMQYVAAIKQAHPKAIQVSDRFHIIKNLTEYAKSHITKIKCILHGNARLLRQ